MTSQVGKSLSTSSKAKPPQYVDNNKRGANATRTLKLLLNLTSSAIRLSISFFIKACFFLINRSFSFETKLRNAGIGSAPGYRKSPQQSRRCRIVRGEEQKKQGRDNNTAPNYINQHNLLDPTQQVKPAITHLTTGSTRSTRRSSRWRKLARAATRSRRGNRRAIRSINRDLWNLGLRPSGSRSGRSWGVFRCR